MRRIEEIECAWAVGLSLLGSMIVYACLAWWISGCVARSEYVDRLAQSQYETSGTLANVAEVQANMATELGSAHAPKAAKLATIAEIQAADSADLAAEKSGPQVNVAEVVGSAVSGNWLELGMGLLTLVGVGAAGYQRNRANKAHALAEEVRDLEPEKAREVWKARKPV